MITSGSTPKAMPGGDECCDHATSFPFHKHPMGGKKVDKHLADHERGAGPPAHHTKGQHPSQLAPDHGPMHHKRR